MRRFSTFIVLSALLGMGCATPEPAASPEPEVDASGLVRVARGDGPGKMFAHPTRSIDHYDDILVGKIAVTYAPGEPPLSMGDAQRLRMKTYDVVTLQIPAVGQLLAGDSGPCTVELGVELAALDLPSPGSREKGATTVILEFHDSVTGDPLVKYVQHRQLDIPTSTREETDLEQLGTELAAVAKDVRERLRDSLPLSAANARADQGCKGLVGQARQRAQGR
jgi:hypothetical protein